MNDMIVKSVDLMGDTVMAAKDGDGNIWVGVKWICAGIGFNKDQISYERKRIRDDIVLGEGVKFYPLGTGNGNKGALCLNLDYVPLWLAKIPITPSMKENSPELVGKLVKYQLQAKDILAAAFFPKQDAIPQTTDDKIKLLAQGHGELRAEVNSIRDDLEALKLDLPIFPVEADRITGAVLRIGVSALGGKHSSAYHNKGLRQRLYNDIYAGLKDNFGVKSYKSIRRSQCDMAVRIIEGYKPPDFLAEQIENANAQQTFYTEGAGNKKSVLE